jgi:hypothetical protein
MLDPALDETLLFLGCVVFGVLAQVTARASAMAAMMCGRSTFSRASSRAGVPRRPWLMDVWSCRSWLLADPARVSRDSSPSAVLQAVHGIVVSGRAPQRAATGDGGRN